MATAAIDLKREPDGLGYRYGQIRKDDGTQCRLDIMPPLPHWKGDLKMEGEGAPHPTDWVIYVDGEEIARVKEWADVEGAIYAKLERNRA